MGRGLNTTFLGKKATMVKPDLKTLKTINAVNNYCLRQNTTTEIPYLGIIALNELHIGTHQDLYSIDGDIYYPLTMCMRIGLIGSDFKKSRNSTYIPRGLFYIKGTKRPDTEYFTNHFLSTLSSEYGGSYHMFLTGKGNPDSRYVMLLENASTGFLRTLLHHTIKGDGSVIDYTWIAPIQDLLESQSDKEGKLVKKSYEEDGEDVNWPVDPELDPYQVVPHSIVVPNSTSNAAEASIEAMFKKGAAKYSHAFGQKKAIAAVRYGTAGLVPPLPNSPF